MLQTEPKLKTCAEPGCENQFRPRFKTTEKFCSSNCAYTNHRRMKEEKNSKEASGDTKKSKTYIKPISDKRSKEMKLYKAKRIEFLSRKENKLCPVTKWMLDEQFASLSIDEFNEWSCNKETDQVHHMRGRIGSLYLNTKFWLAVSPKGHEFIELNPKIAKEKGWSLSRLSKD